MKKIQALKILVDNYDAKVLSELSILYLPSEFDSIIMDFSKKYTLF